MRPHHDRRVRALPNAEAGGGGGDGGVAGEGQEPRAHREHDDDEDIAALGFVLTDKEYDEVCALKEGGKKRKKLLAKFAKNTRAPGGARRS